MKLWIAILTLPLVAGLYRYAVSYGYRGWSKRASLHDAAAIAIMIGAVLCAAVLLASCSGESWRSGNKPDDIAPMSREAERQHIVTQGREFCARYKDDVACKGAK